MAGPVSEVIRGLHEEVALARETTGARAQQILVEAARSIAQARLDAQGAEADESPDVAAEGSESTHAESDPPWEAGKSHDHEHGGVVIDEPDPPETSVEAGEVLNPCPICDVNSATEDYRGGRLCVRCLRELRGW